MSEPAILHRCPSCGQTFDSPSVCSDGATTVPVPDVVPSQWMRENAPALPPSVGDGEREEGR